MTTDIAYMRLAPPIAYTHQTLVVHCTGLQCSASCFAGHKSSGNVSSLRPSASAVSGRKSFVKLLYVCHTKVLIQNDIVSCIAGLLDQSAH